MRNADIAKKKLYKVIDKIGDRNVTPPILCRYLNKEFHSMSVKFCSKQSDYYSLSGYYSGDIQEEDDRRYNIIITYEKGDRFWFYPKKNRCWVDEILSVIIHELRHGHQYKHRSKKVSERLSRVTIGKFTGFVNNEEFEYLSNYDEIDAYAYEVAYINKSGHRTQWIVDRYKNIVAKQSPKLYNRFLKKVYLFSQREIQNVSGR